MTQRSYILIFLLLKSNNLETFPRKLDDVGFQRICPRLRCSDPSSYFPAGVFECCLGTIVIRSQGGVKTSRSLCAD